MRQIRNDAAAIFVVLLALHSVYNHVHAVNNYVFLPLVVVIVTIITTPSVFILPNTSGLHYSEIELFVVAASDPDGKGSRTDSTYYTK